MELAHLPAFVDPRHFRVGFFCEGDVELAIEYERHIGAENVEARRVAPPVPERLSGSNEPALRMRADERPADEIVLPCRPDASDEEIVHAVLATMKASHALEFEIIVDDAAIRGDV